MKVFLTLFVFAITLVNVVSQSSVETAGSSNTCGPRVRKKWGKMTEDEKQLYKRAVASAMDKGEYIKFVELHTELMSEKEAHGNCMFLYWHRMMLAGYENMLRGQGEEFACVTLPYWDWVTGNARLINGDCKNALECSGILSELGGVTSDAPEQTVTINGETVWGKCVSSFPLDHFCDNL